MRGYMTKVTEFSKAVFGGFVLKPGYFYGADSSGRPVATSTCVKDGKVLIYTKVDEDHWTKNWVPVAEAMATYPELITSLNGAN